MSNTDNNYEMLVLALSILLLLVVFAVLVCRYYRGQRLCCKSRKTNKKDELKYSLPLPALPPLYWRSQIKGGVLLMLDRDQPMQKVEVNEELFAYNSESSSSAIELNYKEVRLKREGELSIAIDHNVSEGGRSHIASTATTVRPRYPSDDSSAIFKHGTTSCNQATCLDGEFGHDKQKWATLDNAYHERGERENQPMSLRSEGALSSVYDWKTGEAKSTARVKKRSFPGVPYEEVWPRSENLVLKNIFCQSERSLKNIFCQSESSRLSLPSPSKVGTEELERVSEIGERSSFGTLPSLPPGSNSTMGTLSTTYVVQVL